MSYSGEYNSTKEEQEEQRKILQKRMERTRNTVFLGGLIFSSLFVCGLIFSSLFVFWIFFITTVSPGYVGVVVNLLGENKGEAQCAILKAESEAKANLVLARSVTPELIKWQAIQKWDGKLPKVTGSDPLARITLGKELED